MNERDLPTFLRVSEAAAITSLSEKTIRRRIADGTISARKLRGTILINLADLERALRRVPGP